MDKTALADVAKKLVVDKKGIFAADWSVGSADKHFSKNGIPLGEEERRNYRQMLFATPGLEEYISGVILHEETARQKTDKGLSFPKFLLEKGITPGVRVDEGYEKLESSPKEQVTKGIDTLEKRLLEAKSLGVEFAKWRAPFFVDEVRPSKEAIEENSNLLAQYAYLCQKNGIVPIVEPEVLMDGNHTNAKCEAVTTEILKIVFEKLEEKEIYFEGMILKPNMILPGKDSPVEPVTKEVGHATIRTLKNSISKNVSGVAFLSGGQSPTQATQNLNEIVKVAEDVPWQLTFSFARALQYPAIEIYKGKKENIPAAQSALLKRAKMNSLARQGLYESFMEDEK